MAMMAGMVQLEAATNIVGVVGGAGQPNFLFVPSNSVITVGDTILWTNRSGNAHDVTQGSKAAGTNATPYWAPIQLSGLGAIARVTFSNTGFYPYVCNQHAILANQPGPQTGLVSVVIAPTVVLNGLANGAKFLAPASVAFGATASDADGTITNLALFFSSNLVAQGSGSPLNITLDNVPGGNYSLTARATDNSGVTVTSAPISIIVRHRVDFLASSFTPPVISMKAGETVLFVNGANFHTVTGTGSDPFCGNGAVDTCERTLAAVGSYPYRCLFHSVSQASGMTGTVAVATFNRAPVVSIAGVQNGAVIPPGSFSFQAAAMDPDGAISAVRFYTNDVLIVTDSSFPYASSSINLAPGSYVLTARALDNVGLTTTSAPVNITVSAPSPIELQSPAVSAGGFQFRYTANPGSTYVVEGSANTNGPAPFVAISTNVATNSLMPFSDATSSGRPNRAYRVFRQP